MRTTIEEKTKNMGRVMVSIKIENAVDLGKFELGEIAQEKVRSIEVEDALVDTGAALLCLNTSIIERLGLHYLKTITVDTATGSIPRRIFKNAWLTILGRSCPINVVEISSKNQALVGYLALESIDLIVDPKARKVIPNPEHGDEMILDLL